MHTQKLSRPWRDERGMGLLFGLLTAAIVAAIAWTMMTSSLVDMAISDNYRSHSAAFYAADAGVEQTLIDFKVDDDWILELVNLDNLEFVVPGPATVTINGHTVTLQVDGDGNVIPGFYAMGQATAIGDGNFTREVWMPPAIGFGDCGDVDAPDSSPGDKASSKAKSKDDSDDGDDGDDEDEDDSKASSKASSKAKSKDDSDDSDDGDDGDDEDEGFAEDDPTPEIPFDPCMGEDSGAKTKASSKASSKAKSKDGSKASSKAKSKDDSDDSDDGDDGDDEDEDVVGDDGRVSVCHWAGDEARTLHVSPATSALHTTSHGSDYLGACTVADGGGSDGSDLSGEEAAFSVPVYLSIRVRATGTSTNASNTNLAADIVYEIAPDGTINQVAVRNWHRN